jgi:hypothetical protein
MHYSPHIWSVGAQWPLQFFTHDDNWANESAPGRDPANSHEVAIYGIYVGLSIIQFGNNVYNIMLRFDMDDWNLSLLDAINKFIRGSVRGRPRHPRSHRIGRHVPYQPTGSYINTFNSKIKENRCHP